SIILVLLGIALIFELLGWTFRGQSFLFNTQRLLIIILQVSIIGLLAIGVTQVIITGVAVGALAGLVNGSLVAFGAIPAFIATLGMMVTARGLARFYTQGQPISLLSDSYTRIGEGAFPVVIFVM